MAQKRDYYEVLGISKTANADEIKKAYRKLARKFHPDVNKNDPAAEGKFKEVQEAYDTLTDEKKRQAYDQFGHAGVDSAAAAAAAAAAAGRGHGTGGFRYSAQTPGGATVDFGDVDLSDLFEQLTGSGRRGGGGGRRGGPQMRDVDESHAGRDIAHEVTLSFLDAIRGTSLDLRFSNPDGSDAHTIAVKIPPGVDEGSKIRVRGKGQQSPFGGPPGDLIITTHVTPHPFLLRQGKDIILDMPVSASEAANGATIQVPTIDGNVELRVPPGMNSGKKLRIRGRGVPQRDGSRGDQYCRVQIYLPPELTEEEKKQLAALDAAHQYDPRSKGW